MTHVNHCGIQGSSVSVMDIPKILVTTGFIHFAFITSIFACSYADGSLSTTHYDHVKAAAVILLAEPYSKSGNKVDFHIREVLKGDFAAKEYTASEVNTSCAVIRFPLNRETNLPPLLAEKLPKVVPKYLLFLERVKGNWRLSIGATEAMNSPIWDDQTSDSLIAVRHLIRVSDKNDYEAEKRELKQLARYANLGRQPQKYPKLLGKLIDDHLSTPTPNKTFTDLLDIFRSSESEVKRDVLWAFAWGGHKEAAELFESLIDSPIPLNYIGPLSQYITTTRHEGLLVRLGRNYPALDSSSRWPLMWALIKTADERHVGLMMAALRSANKEEAGRLTKWFVRFPNAEATEIVRLLVGGEYREKWELTFGLAGMGDSATISWAKEFMKTDDEKRWIAFYTIAHSPLVEADILARGVIEGSDTDGLTSLIQGYEESHNPNKYDRLLDIIRLPKKDPKVEHWLKRTLVTMSEDGDLRSSVLLTLLGN